MNNCDIANQRKVLESARRQLTDILMIEKSVGLKQLPHPAYEAAKYRKRYPEASILEIKELMEEKSGKSISKSAINHRFRSIREFADKLRA
jgi:DNA-binding protein WhiA